MQRAGWVLWISGSLLIGCTTPNELELALASEGDDGDLFGGELEGEEQAPQEEEGVLELELRGPSRLHVGGFQLPLGPGAPVRVTQFPHAYRAQIWNAIDLGMPWGTEIRAAKAGVVSALVDELKDYAPRGQCRVRACNRHTNFLILQHDDGTETSYLHLMQHSARELGLSNGSRVCRGQVIARVGNNGFTSGPHLHVSAQRAGSGGPRFEAWREMWSKPTLVMDFDELAGQPMRGGRTYVSANGSGCGDGGTGQADAGAADAGLPDAGLPDAGSVDAGVADAGAPGRPCYSRTLGRRVASGECVQMAYAACGGRCRWARCDQGAWSCADPSTDCEAQRHPHAACSGP